MGDLLGVPREPDRREMPPAELSADDIPAVGKGVANVDRVVAALDIVLPVLLVFGHDGMRERRIV